MTSAERDGLRGLKASIDIFIDMYPAVVQTLEQIKNSAWNSETCTQANGLHSSITKFEFIIALFVVSNCLNYCLSLTRKLQLKEMDIIKGYREIGLLQSTLDYVRTNLNEKHHVWYLQAENLARTVNCTPSIPRTCAKQTLRENYLETDPEAYYRQALTVQFLDHLCTQLSTRFDKSSLEVMNGFNIIPEFMRYQVENDKDWKTPFLEFVNMYSADIPHSQRLLEAEMEMWETYWLRRFIGVVPDTIVKTLHLAHDLKATFPAIFTALRILDTIPVTSCQCERSISSLRRLKTFLRSTMEQETLNGLALMLLHRDITIDLNAVINMFANLRPTRMKLANILDSDDKISDNKNE